VQHPQSMGEEKSEAVAVLRDIWATNGAIAAELDACRPTGKVRKDAAMPGMQAMNDGRVEDPRVAAIQSGEWRQQMIADGKTPVNARSIGAEFASQIESAGQV
jgi:hypothetical protein